MRPDYEGKWDDLKIFIQYGMRTDEKFAEKAANFMLWKSIEGKYYTAEEYTEKVKDMQTDKDGFTIMLYTDDIEGKDSFIEAAKAKGYDILEMNGQLDSHYIQYFESKHEKIRFVRVDSDVVENLIRKEERAAMSLTTEQQQIMRPVFESQMPHDEKIQYHVSFEAMSADAAPVVITQNEFMRRMKDMAATSGGEMSRFYAQMPDNFSITVNGNHPIVLDILGEVEREYGDKLRTIGKKIVAAEQEESRFEETVKDKKDADLTPEERDMRETLSKHATELRQERDSRLEEIGKQNRKVRQLIDLALLSNGMLKGKNLTDFIQRSISLIE
jgi:molecular chaperone HtpG